jgi:MHS family proline/betaine transporter-like MFS transporter
MPSALSELFPTHVRYTALSVGYNSAVMVFGGFAPFISTLLIKLSDSAMAPGFYVVFCAVISLSVALRLRARGPRLAAA